MAGKKSQLSPEMKKEIVELTIETYNREIENQRKKQYDRKLRNTRLLLEHYREFVGLSERAVYEASQCDEDVYDILSLMSGRPSEQEMQVESIKKSAMRTTLILEHVRKALEDYETYCKRSKRDEEMRRFRTVCRLYIEEEPWDVQMVAADESIDISTVYKDIKEATRRLTPRIFGIDGLR